VSLDNHPAEGFSSVTLAYTFLVCSPTTHF
jgi:hypothetical protein